MFYLSSNQKLASVTGTYLTWYQSLNPTKTIWNPFSDRAGGCKGNRIVENAFKIMLAMIIHDQLNKVNTICVVCTQTLFAVILHLHFLPAASPHMVSALVPLPQPLHSALPTPLASHLHLPESSLLHTGDFTLTVDSTEVSRNIYYP